MERLMGGEKAQDQLDGSDDLTVVIVTGIAGSGKSTALAAFEDLGYHTLDNLPLALLGTLFDMDHTAHQLAIGLDARSLTFSVDRFVAEVTALRDNEKINLHILMMDASDDALIRRFSETRRRHPFSAGPLCDGPLRDGADAEDGATLEAAIGLERRTIGGVRDCVDAVVDTSYRSSADTRRLILDRYARAPGNKMAINIISFGYSFGLPRDADMVFDVRFLRNPHYDPALKPLTGQTSEVANFVKADEAYLPFFNQVISQLDFLLPLMEQEGKSYFTLAFGCTGGKHRSVTLAEHVTAHLSEKGYAPRLDHRNMPGQNRRRLGDAV